MGSHDPSRRALLRQSMLLAGAVVAGEAATGADQRVAQKNESRSVARPASDRVLTRVAFGSCAKESKDQPIWETVLAMKPDVFVFLGDNVYGDTRDMALLRQKYAQLAAKPGFRRLRETIPLVATWDDHDYGEDDAGADYPMREESRRIFLEFWGEPADSPRWQRDGIYTSYLFGPAGRRVQIILPDLRYNRTPITKIDLAGAKYEDWAKAKERAGLPVPGPYVRDPERSATMLGEPQWAWLEQQLEVSADIRIIASSLQVLADLPGWEAWINYARDHQRLIELIRRQNASGVVFISGDTHYGELSRLDANVPYAFWDLTSSGLTEVWPVVPPNANRIGEVLREANFGVIEINWNAPDPRVVLQVRDTSGRARIEHELRLSALNGVVPQSAGR